MEIEIDADTASVYVKAVASGVAVSVANRWDGVGAVLDKNQTEALSLALRDALA